MTKVYLDEINSALSFSTFDTLEQDNKDSTSVGGELSGFIETSSEKLSGDQWDKVRTKLGTYQEALNKRAEVATNLGNAITEALKLLKDYLGTDEMLDTSRLEEYKTQRNNCNDCITKLNAMLNETVTKSYKKADGTIGYRTVPAYDNDYIKSQIYLAEATLKELDRLIEKIEGLPAVYKQAEGIMETAYQEVVEFQKSVSSIKPSGKFVYQKANE